MNPDPVTAMPTAQLGDAVQTMLEARTDSLLVVSDGRLVGIVKTQDVLAVLGKMLSADHNGCQRENVVDASSSLSEGA